MEHSDTKNPQLRTAVCVKRGLWAVLLLVFLMGAILAATRFYMTTTSGARFIESQINKRSFGPLERVEISGMSGDPLSDVAIETLSIYDKQGLWFTATGIDVAWNPWSLRRKEVELNIIHADAVEVLRHPILNESQPSTALPTLQLKDAAIKSLSLNEALLGQNVRLQTQASLSTNRQGAVDVKLQATRTDVKGDSIHLDFSRTAEGLMRGDFDLIGLAGGPVAMLIQAPERENVKGEGVVEGNALSGAGQLTLSFNAREAIIGKAIWTKDTANFTAEIKTTEWKLFDRLPSTIGPKLNVEAQLNRAKSLASYKVNLVAEGLKATAKGDLNESGGIVDGIAIALKANSLNDFLPLPNDYQIAAGVLNGELRLKPTYKFEGIVDLENPMTPYGQAKSLVGPVSLEQKTKTQYQLETDLFLNGLNLDNSLPIEISDTANFKSDINLNSESSEIVFKTLSILSGETRLTAKGALNYGVGQYDFNGNAIVNLNTIGALPSGKLQTDFNVIKGELAYPTVKAEGAFLPSGALNPAVEQFFKSGLNFSLDTSATQKGVSINEAQIEGENLRAALAGNLTEKLDIDGKVSLSAPLQHELVSLSGKTNMSFTISGDRLDPNLRLDATSEQVNIKGYAFDGPRLRTEVTNLLNAPKGPARFTANTRQGPLDVSVDFLSNESSYAAENIDLVWGQLRAQGTLSKSANAPVTGLLEANLPQKGEAYANAKLALYAKGDEQALDLNLDAKNVAYETLAFDTLLMKLSGTSSALTGQVDLEGQRQIDLLERPFEFKSPLNLSLLEDGSYLGTFNPQAQYGGAVVNTSAPVTLRYKSGDIEFDGPMTLNGTPFFMSYDRITGLESLNLKTDDLPIALLPLPDFLADTHGFMNVNLALQSSPEIQGVTGQATVQLIDWRGHDKKSGKGLSGIVDLDIANRLAQWKFDLKSEDGFTATSDGKVPIKQGQTITDIRPDLGATLSGQLKASGEAASILGLFTPNDAKPRGELSANLVVSGTLGDPLVEGTAQGQSLRLEAPELGTQLREGQFIAAFTNDTLSIRDVSVMDKNEGSLKGKGEFKLGEFGRPIGALNIVAKSFTALDRQDYESRISGTLDFNSKAERSKLSGDITLKEVEVKQFVTGGATVIEIPVVEINKPEKQNVIEIVAPEIPIDLDVKIRAPRKIFVRSRGLDVELSLDARLQGTVDAPEIYGEAVVERGGYRIAGKELAFDSGSIKFDGAIDAAVLDLLASTTTQDISADVTISGTVANPVLELSSEPDRPQDEILSALLFGRSATELSAIEAAQLAGALAQFSGVGGGFDLMGGLRDALGIGQLSLSVGEDGNAQVAGGRYLAKNVYLQILSGGSSEQTRAVIDWEIRENVSLISKVQADNDQSFSLKWKKDF